MTDGVACANGHLSGLRWKKGPIGALGGNAGDTTGGAFRFTCNNTNHVGLCKITIRADGPAGTKVYPRVLIHRQDYVNAGPSVYCEYADGADNDDSAEPVAGLATPLAFGVGSSFDCGASQPGPASNIVVSELWVPAGYYDVWSTFTFQPA